MVADPAAVPANPAPARSAGGSGRPARPAAARVRVVKRTVVCATTAAEPAGTARVGREPLGPAGDGPVPGRGAAVVEAVLGPEPAPVIGGGDRAHEVAGHVRAGRHGGQHDETVHANAPIRGGIATS